MSYAAMLSPFSMPYPKQGKVYNVKKGTHDYAPAIKVNYIYITDPVTGERTPMIISGQLHEEAVSVTKIKKGDLLCVTKNKDGITYVFPAGKKIIKTTKNAGGQLTGAREDFLHEYQYKINLPVMGVALTSENSRGELTALLISTNPFVPPAGSDSVVSIRNYTVPWDETSPDMGVGAANYPWATRGVIYDLGNGTAIMIAEDDTIYEYELLEDGTYRLIRHGNGIDWIIDWTDVFE